MNYDEINIPDELIGDSLKTNFGAAADVYWFYEYKLKRRLNDDEKQLVYNIVKDKGRIGKTVHPASRGTFTPYKKISSLLFSKKLYSDKDTTSDNEDVDTGEFREEPRKLPPRFDLRHKRTPKVDDPDLEANEKERKANLKESVMILKTSKAEVADLYGILKSGSANIDNLTESMVRNGYSVRIAREIIRDAVVTGYAKRIGSRIFATEKGWLDIDNPNGPVNPDRNALDAGDYTYDNSTSTLDDITGLKAKAALRRRIKQRIAQRRREAVDIYEGDTRQLQSKNPTYPRFKEDVISNEIGEFAHDLVTNKRKSSLLVWNE
ncbi:MAG: hypothetical protein WC783_00955 [Candidatus Paceibacterota bacterium]|jgi:hypothetical protein